MSCPHACCECHFRSVLYSAIYLMYYFYSLVLFRWSTSKHNGVNSFKFVDTYFRGFLKKCIFMDTDVRFSHAIVSLCVYGDKYSLDF